MHTYLLIVSSVHNDEDDDSGMQDSGNPVQETTLFENCDSALIAAEQHVMGACDDEERAEVTDNRRTYSPDHPYNVTVKTWHSFTHVTVDRLEVLQH